jgi:hypothetical protein
LGYYLEFVEKKSEFTKEDLEKAWSKTREAVPSKDVFRIALGNTSGKYQYLVTASQKGAYRVSRRGQQVVDVLPAELSKDLIGFAKRKGKSKSKLAKKTS